MSRRASTSVGPTGPSWAVLADVLLRRAALVVRVAFDHRPDPLAGLKVDDEDLEKLLTELPGLAVADQSVIAAIERETRPAVDAARAQLQADVSSISGPDAFCRLVRFARLSDLETEVLALSCAIEVDPRRQRVVGYLNDDVGQRRLTLFTLQVLFPERPGVALAVSPGSGLRRAALLAPLEAGPLGTVSLAPSPALLWWLAGDLSRDLELPAGVEHVRRRAPDKQVPTRSRARAAPADPLQQGSPAGRGDGDGLFLVPGKDKLRRRQAATEKLGDLLASPLPGSIAAWDALVRRATLEESAVLIELDGSLPPEACQRIEHATHLSWALASNEELPLDGLPHVPWQELAVGDAQATNAEWQAAISGLQGGDQPPDGAARNQNLTAEQLELVRLSARGVGGFHDAVRRLAAGHISALAPRIRPSRSWEDLVLDPDRTRALREVVARCRHKRTVFDEWGFSPLPSGGVVALFSGPSGTGKTLAAEIIAGELSLDIYKIDLAALVSKWVGETEKNLAQVFSAAEASNVALFFDEADAIFGKRSEVAGRARPLREHRGRLPAPASRALRGPGCAGFQSGQQYRPGFLASCPCARGFPDARRTGAQAHLGTEPPVYRSSWRPRYRPPGKPVQAVGWLHSQRRANSGLYRSRRWYGRHHGVRRRGGAEGAAQAGPAADARRLRAIRPPIGRRTRR